MTAANGSKFTQGGLNRVGIDIDLVGVGDLVDELDRMVANAVAAEDEALQAAAEPILAEAQQTTAFIDHTHKLRDSLKIGKTKLSMGKGRKGRYKLIGSFDKNVAYALEVEYGHSSPGGKGYTKAHPFLEPAFIHHRQEAQEIIANKLREALSK
jgi:HK97 gp10 family phage protein